jgi:hypothetical protein
MKEDNYGMFRQVIFEKISTDEDIKLLGKKLNIEISQKSIGLVLQKGDWALDFLAKTEITEEISNFCIAEHGYCHRWLCDEGGHFGWAKDLVSRDSARITFANKSIFKNGGGYCIPKSGEDYELVDYIRGRKESKNNIIEFIHLEDIAIFFERVFDSLSAEKVPIEDIKNPESQISKALKIIIYPISSITNGYQEFSENLWNNGLNLQKFINKYWAAGLKDSPVLDLPSLLVHCPELWQLCEERIDEGRIDVSHFYKSMRGSMGLEEYRRCMKRRSWIVDCCALNFEWFPDIVNDEHSSIDWKCLSANNHINWTEHLIREWSRKIDFKLLSQNSSVAWTLDLILEYESYWDWSALSANESVPWDSGLISAFSESIDWAELSANSSLPWSNNLLKEFENNWVWSNPREVVSLAHGRWREVVKNTRFSHPPWRAKWRPNSFMKTGPWGGKSISTNTGILWNPELLCGYEDRLDIWALSANATLNSDCIRFLFKRLFECRPAFRYTAKFSDFSPDHYIVSLTGWHLLFLNEYACIDASLLDEIYDLDFKRTPDEAVDCQEWQPPVTSSALDLLLDVRYNRATALNFAVDFADCINRSETWGTRLVKHALQGNPARYGCANHERRYKLLLSDVRAFLNNRRNELFELKVSTWDMKTELRKEELALKVIWKEFCECTEFHESIELLESRVSGLSAAEAWLAMFVIICRFDRTVRSPNYMNRFGFRTSSGNFRFPDNRKWFNDFSDISEAISGVSDHSHLKVASIRVSSNEALAKTKARELLRNYWESWSLCSKSKTPQTLHTIAEVVYQTHPTRLDELLKSTLTSYGLQQDGFGDSIFSCSEIFSYTGSLLI